jgi:hypothetical protein
MDEEKVYAIKMGNAMRLLDIPESSIRKAI